MSNGLLRTTTSRLTAVVLLLAVAGCAPLGPPPPVETRPPPPVEEQPRVEPPPRPDTTPPRDPGAIRPDQRVEEVESPPSPVAGLLAQGWRLHSADDHQGALNVAERAQRIEPRNAEVYLLMASAQFGLYRLDIAEQLARRGLSLSRAGTQVNAQLQGLLTRIVGAR